MRILGIETSCDETALSIVETSGGLNSPKFKILKSVVASQIKIHQPFGGVVPNLAKREHIKNLPILLNRILKNFDIKDIDLIAVTVGPGLEPALWAGITFAEDLSKKNKIPLIGVNHLEGHLYSFLLPKKTASSKLPSFTGFDKLTTSKVSEGKQASNIFPAIALIVSGGHTILLLLKNLKTWKKLGETRDDAVGEAYDKVARMLNLPYPGGPEIQKLSKKGDRTAINFPRPMIYEKNYDFSFSGLKTAVLYYMREQNRDTNIQMRANDTNKKISLADIAASFQSSAVEVLNKKTERALKEFKAKSILLSGGVAANLFLRQELKKMAKRNEVRFFVAEQKYNTDNAVMIAVAGYMGYLRKKKYPMKANGNLGI